MRSRSAEIGFAGVVSLSGLSEKPSAPAGGLSETFGTSTADAWRRSDGKTTKPTGRVPDRLALGAAPREPRARGRRLREQDRRDQGKRQSRRMGSSFGRRG